MSRYAYHFLGHLMDATLFALCKIPAIRARFWDENPYYRETQSEGPSSASPLLPLLRLANSVGLLGVAGAPRQRFGAAGMLFTATPRR